VRAPTLYLVFCSAPFAIPGFSRAIPLLHVAIKRLTSKGDYAMTQAITHSPTPWQDNDAGLIYGQVSGDDDEAPFVADVCNNPGSGEYTEQEQANAAFIVRACNAHSELLAALQSLVAMIDPYSLDKQGREARANALRAIWKATPQRATDRPGDQAALMHEETGIDYETCLIKCNMD
jgi:hypothetical protein